jgi:hypothetical protein
MILRLMRLLSPSAVQMELNSRFDRLETSTQVRTAGSWGRLVP